MGKYKIEKSDDTGCYNLLINNKVLLANESITVCKTVEESLSGNRDFIPVDEYSECDEIGVKNEKNYRRYKTIK